MIISKVIVINKKGIVMLEESTKNDIENLKKQINEAANLSLILNDSLIYGIDKQIECKPVLVLIDLLAYKLKLIEDDYGYLVSRFKQ